MSELRHRFLTLLAQESRRRGRLLRKLCRAEQKVWSGEELQHSSERNVYVGGETRTGNAERAQEGVRKEVCIGESRRRETSAGSEANQGLAEAKRVTEAEPKTTAAASVTAATRADHDDSAKKAG